MNLGCPSSCPIVAAGAAAREFPVGQVRRVASTAPPGEVDETKRNVLKLLAVAGLVGAAGGGLVAGSLPVRPAADGRDRLVPDGPAPRPRRLPPHRDEGRVRVQRHDERGPDVPLPAHERAELPPQPRPGDAGRRRRHERQERGRPPEVDRGVQRHLPAPGLPGAGDLLLSARDLLGEPRRPPVLHPLHLPRVDLRPDERGGEPHRARPVLPLPQVLLDWHTDRRHDLGDRSGRPPGQRPPLDPAAGATGCRTRSRCPSSRRSCCATSPSRWTGWGSSDGSTGRSTRSGGSSRTGPGCPSGRSGPSPSSRSSRRSWTGAFVVTAFLYQVVSGLLLLLYYQPSVNGTYTPCGQPVGTLSSAPAAWCSTYYLIHSVPMGQLLLSTHLYGAYAMIFLALVHFYRGYYLGVYKAPREFSWMVGTLLMLATLGMGFTGYLLPYTQISLNATNVGLVLALRLPTFGPLLGPLILADGTGQGLFIEDVRGPRPAHPPRARGAALRAHRAVRDARHRAARRPPTRSSAGASPRPRRRATCRSCRTSSST